MDTPINYAIKFPHRIQAESTINYASGQFETRLHFSAVDGSTLTVILSPKQVSALGRIEATDPEKMARDLYVAGHIEVDEYERRLDRCAR